MKTFLRILSLSIIMAVSLSACTEDPEITTGNISGTVTTASGGIEPLSGVTVSILSTGQSTTTGNNGAFTFTNLQAGSYSLQFSKTGYNTNSRTVNVIAGQSYQCDVQMTKVSQEADLEINPSSLNFGTTQTDLSVTIKNNGNVTADWSLDLGNNHWLSVSQTGGSLQAGKTQSITFTVDRNYLSETKTVIVNIQSFGNSYPIHISCAPKNTTSEMNIDPTELNFGTTLLEKTFTIRNTGKDALNWSASNIKSTAISLSSDKGTVPGGGSSVVTVILNRDKFDGTLNTTFVISDGIKDVVVTVTANVTGAGNDNPNDPNNGSFVVRNGILAYFPFNGNFDDISGNDVYGFGSPDPTFTDGVTNGTRAISFSKMTGNAFVVNHGLIDSRSMTICFWIKNVSEGNIFNVTSSNKGDGGEEMMTLTYRDGHLKYVVSRYNNHYNFNNTGNFTHKKIDDEGWHHVALVADYNKLNYSASTTSLYIDGRLMDTVTEDINVFGEAESSGKHYGTGTKFILGGSGVPNMQIAYMRVYDARQLSADEIKAIYEAKQ